MISGLCAKKRVWGVVLGRVLYRVRENEIAALCRAAATLLSVSWLCLVGCQSPSRAAKQEVDSGNPIFPGWYADPEGAVFGKRFWVYPTYSAPYGQQVFLDAFSSPDLVTWTKHSRILDTNRVTWARRAMWAPAVVEQGGRYFFFFGA